MNYCINLLSFFDCATVVTVGFVPENYTVDENDVSVTLSVELIQGTLERNITVTTPGTATETGAK